MAGTMPHAIFIETNADGAGGVAAYAAELPGCATFAATDEEASRALPRRVDEFCAWLRSRGEEAPTFVGDNWYEVERATAVTTDGVLERAAFSLDELPPTDDEFERWLAWLELAREELADALDQAGDRLPGDLVERIATQDERLALALGADASPPREAFDAVDRLYAARDALTDAMVAAGPAGEGVRRAVRLAIADDLRAAEALRERSA
ncbi:MAG TPA: hypothetical protein VHK63_01645 [Candidatus Limnocylindria bacterium]|nr:hypothetical protein [Candidatus Limnocylindria bacterium]